jgi:hypothetical protein
MKKSLLAIGLLLASLPTMAQEFFNYGFETPSSELTVGKLDYVNFLEGDTIDPVSTTARTGSYALKLKNSANTAGSNWQRALKFRNFAFEPSTSYRVDFWVRGDNTYTATGATASSTSNIKTALMVGKENADVPFIAAESNTFGTTFTGFDPSSWVKKSAMFFYTSDAAQQDYYASLYPDSAALSLQYFLAMNVYNPGTYYIDDISIRKSTIKGITFNNDVIKVDFGYAVNATTMGADMDYSTAVLPVESATVTLNGTALEIEAVEAQPTGFYIFLKSDYLLEADNGNVVVSFNNPNGTDLALQYTGPLRPNSLSSTTDMEVLDFTNEDAAYDADLLNISSSIYMAPFLKSASPENESFDLPLTANTFKLVFSKKIDCSTVKATLGGPAAFGTVNLTLAESSLSDTLTFSVPAANSLIDGSYILSVKDIASDMGTSMDDLSLSYVFGSSANAEIDTLIQTKWATTGTEHGSPGNASVPYGYKIVWNSGAVLASGASGLSGCPRMFLMTGGGDLDAGIYMSPRGNSDSVRVYYGAYDGYRLNLEPGKYIVSFNTAYWTTASQTSAETINFAVKDTFYNEVYSQKSIAAAGCFNNSASTKVTGTQYTECTFTITEQKDYLLEWYVLPAVGWNALILGNVQMISVPSVAARYKNMLSTVLVQARASLVLADSSIYDGTAKDDLTAKIAYYSTVAYTAPSAYVSATDTVTAAIAAMTAYKATVDAHYALIETYKTNVETAKTTISTYAGTKYDVLDAYPQLQAVVAIYDGLELTDDDSLTVANDTLSFYTNLMTNWVETCIPARTYRLTKAVTLAQQLEVPDTYLTAAQETFYDDDDLANELNSRIKTYLYNWINLDSLKFGQSVVDSTLTDSLDLTNYIKNPNLYSAKTTSGFASVFPGWITGNNTSGFAQTLATAVCPVVDTYAGVFNTVVDTFYQTVTNVPAGVYNVNIYCRMAALVTGITEADMAGVSQAYLVIGTDTSWLDFKPGSYGIPAATLISFRDKTIADGSFTLGVKTQASPYTTYTPTYFWGDPGLFMVGKAAGFTYPYTAVKDVEAVRTVKSVMYYNFQGIRISGAPVKGLYIVKKIYDNGTFDVQKIMIK